jgi:hypothetical protein
MIYLIEYNRRRGRLDRIEPFAPAAAEQAHERRLALELDLLQRGLDHEVVLLEAASEAELRKTHRRYFETLDEIARLP